MMPPAEQIPSRLTVVPYYITGALAFILATAMCISAAASFTGHYFQPKILAITHMAVLGWATMIILGASNQLAPVIAETRLWNEKIPLAVLGMLMAGAGTLTAAFWQMKTGVQSFAGGGLIVFSFLLHAFNQFKTFASGKRSTATRFMLTAQLWLILTASLGLLLLLNLRYAFLPALHFHYLKVHASVGMAGWFLQLVMGVSSKLIPMFLLSSNERHQWLNVAYYLLNAGLIVFLVAGLFIPGATIAPVSLLLISGALYYYFRFVRECRKSAMRKRLDQGMQQTFIALLLIAVPLLLLAVILFVKQGLPPGWGTAFGFAFLAGFISIIIMAQTFKTLPFVVWMHLNTPDELPDILPADLYSEHWVKAQLWIYLPGFFLFLTGTLLRLEISLYTGAILMTTAAIIYAGHVLFIVQNLKWNGDRHQRS